MWVPAGGGSKDPKLATSFLMSLPGLDSSLLRNPMLARKQAPIRTIPPRAAPLGTKALTQSMTRQDYLESSPHTHTNDTHRTHLSDRQREGDSSLWRPKDPRLCFSHSSHSQLPFCTCHLLSQPLRPRGQCGQGSLASCGRQAGRQLSKGELNPQGIRRALRQGKGRWLFTPSGTPELSPTARFSCQPSFGQGGFLSTEGSAPKLRKGQGLHRNHPGFSDGH